MVPNSRQLCLSTDTMEHPPTVELLVQNAAAFAMWAHADQFRRHTGEPYWLHLAQVAGLVQAFGGGPAAIASAWLHDVLEDQPHASDELMMEFPVEVTAAVLALSDLEKGNRKARKAAAVERLSGSPGWVQTIKVCDLLSNASSLRVFEPLFWKECFKPEAEALLEALTRADSRAAELLRNILVNNEDM